MANTKKGQKVGAKKNSAMRLIGAGVLVVLVAVLAISLLTGDDKQGEGLIRPEPTMGNAQANLSNGGMTVISGDEFFYSDPSQDNRIFRAKPGDPESGTAVAGLQGMYLNTDGESLYYVNAADHRLMKAGMDGSNPVVLLDKRVSRLTLAGDQLYYLDMDENSLLYRIDTAGEGQPMLLSDARMMQYAFALDKIFYHDLNQNGQSFCMDMNGTNVVGVPQKLGQSIFTSGSRLFFSDPARDGAISYFGITQNGTFTAATELNTGIALCAVADSKHVYYVKAEDGMMYRLSLADGSDPVRMTDKPVYGLQIVGDYVYYFSVLDDGAIGFVEKTATA